MIKSREVVRILEANGWNHKATKGDHWQYEKGGVKVTVQHPVKDLSRRNIASIEKATGLRLRP